MIVEEKKESVIGKDQKGSAKGREPRTKYSF
jgi:hypothetical protein